MLTSLPLAHSVRARHLVYWVRKIGHRAFISWTGGSIGLRTFTRRLTHVGPQLLIADRLTFSLVGQFSPEHNRLLVSVSVVHSPLNDTHLIIIPSSEFHETTHQLPDRKTTFFPVIAPPSTMFNWIGERLQH